MDRRGLMDKFVLQFYRYTIAMRFLPILNFILLISTNILLMEWIPIRAIYTVPITVVMVMSLIMLMAWVLDSKLHFEQRWFKNVGDRHPYFNKIIEKEGEMQKILERIEKRLDKMEGEKNLL